MRKKFVVIISIIFIFIVIFVLFNYFSKLNIFNKYLAKLDELNSLNNYSVKISESNGANSEYYYRNGDFVYKYILGNDERTFYITANEKLLFLNNNGIKSVSNIYTAPIVPIIPTNNYNSISIIDKIKYIFNLSVKSDKNYYIINDKIQTVWLDKDFNIIKTDDSNSVSEYTWQINSVSDFDLQKPDLTDYKAE